MCLVMTETCKAKIKKIAPLDDTTMHIVLDASIKYKPGQFIMVLKDGVSRAYSICAMDGVKVELAVKRIEGGFMSNYLCDLRVGDIIDIKGPFGPFDVDRARHSELVFLASGCGIAPFRAMIPYALKKKLKVVLYYGSRYEKSLLFKDDFYELEKRYASFKFVPVVSREADFGGEKGHVQDVLARSGFNPAGKEIYVSGLRKMGEEVVEMLKKLGADAKELHVECF